jgi:hypothetical protein
METNVRYIYKTFEIWGIKYNFITFRYLLIGVNGSFLHWTSIKLTFSMCSNSTNTYLQMDGYLFKGFDLRYIQYIKNDYNPITDYQLLWWSLKTGSKLSLYI